MNPIHIHADSRIQPGCKLFPVNLKVMYREEVLRIDKVCRLNEFFVRKGIWEILWQEGNINPFGKFHVGNKLCITGKIDLESSKIEDVAIPLPFYMERMSVIPL